MAVPLPGDLPEIGLVEKNTAAGFLIITDTSCAIIDFYISNPKAEKVKVGRALKEITTGLLDHVRRAGIKRVKCTTQLESIKKLAKSNGFRSLGQYESFTLEVGNG